MGGQPRLDGVRSVSRCHLGYTQLTRASLQTACGQRQRHGIHSQGIESSEKLVRFVDRLLNRERSAELHEFAHLIARPLHAQVQLLAHLTINGSNRPTAAVRGVSHESPLVAENRMCGTEGGGSEQH